MSRPQLILIDGHALAYRQYFALPMESFRTRTGEATNAIFGFARTLLDILDEQPDYLAVTFDQGLSGRGELYADYKGTRDKMPDDLRTQIERIRDVVRAFNIPILEMDGYEADDVLGTVARQAAEQEIHVRIITGDRDLLQLITEETCVQLPGKRFADAQIYDLARFQEEYLLEPWQLVELKGLMGDTSDNIPGVKGVGEKTALTLIQTYETIDGVYEHLDELTPGLRKKLENDRENAFLSRELARIHDNVPVRITIEACVAKDYQYADVERLFRQLEFRSLIDRVPGKPETDAAPDIHQMTMFEVAEAQQAAITAPPTEGVVPYVIVDDPDKLAALVQALESAEAIAWDVETSSLDQMQSELVGIALATSGEQGWYVPVGHVAPNAPPHPDEQAQLELVAGHTPKQLPLAQVIDALRPALTDPRIPKIAHNATFDHVVMRRYGIDVQPIAFDTMVAEWLCDPASRNLGLKNLAWIRADVQMTNIHELIGTGKNQITMERVPVEHAAPYAAADAAITYRLMDLLRPELEEKRVWKLFSEIEMPLIPVLSSMEMAGVMLDLDYLRSLSADLHRRLGVLQQEVFALSGGYGEFNLSSPKQLNDVLFGKLGLPTEGLPKTTHGLSTAAEVLEGLREYHPIISAILAWRELSKLLSTYVDALPALVNPHTGRVHTDFNQTGTATGRVSSSNPNLQNIPVRTEEGRRVRHAFVAPPGYKLLSVDYSQVELRILAHFSHDPGLLEAFRQGLDIHRATAAAVYNVPQEQVTYEQRAFAKSVNFGLMYGMGAFRLARDSQLTLAEAENFITNYFRQFPGVRQYLDSSLAFARQHGYVETLLGRRRNFPELHEKRGQKVSFQIRQRAEREAINMPIQGTAADIIKIAMIELARALERDGYEARMILQVHDELVLEVRDDEVERVAPLVVQTMEAAFELEAPLRADARVGQNWAEMTALDV
ncbi:MAG: DNA polymerase I [Chloroflexi bacterium]|nr:DNA polymerase I [Chloroflexota bacterium]